MTSIPISSKGSAILAAIVLSSASAKAVILLEDFNLGGTTQTTTTWTTLSGSNFTLAPDAGSDPGTLALGGAVFQASFGLYAFGGDYTVSVTQGASVDIKTVVLQVETSPNPDFAWPVGAGPVLSLNGGATLIPANFFATGQTESRLTFGTDPLPYADYVWQWDLSAYSGVTSVSIVTPFAIHTSTTAFRIDTGDTFGGYVSPIPEPSAALVSLLGTGLMLRRRRS